MSGWWIELSVTAGVHKAFSEYHGLNVVCQKNKWTNKNKHSSKVQLKFTSSGKEACETHLPLLTPPIPGSQQRCVLSHPHSSWCHSVDAWITATWYPWHCIGWIYFHASDAALVSEQFWDRAYTWSISLVPGQWLEHRSSQIYSYRIHTWIVNNKHDSDKHLHLPV